jgi:hypothetical protein
MHKNATKCNKTQSKWCINKHGASKIIDTFETYQSPDQMASGFVPSYHQPVRLYEGMTQSSTCNGNYRTCLRQDIHGYDSK